MSYLAHPTTVSFAGMSGGILSVRISPGRGSASDVTSLSSAVQNGRVVRDYECLSIESGTASVTMLGSPGFSRSDIGTQASLSVSTPSGSASATAILASWELEASVGELVKGTAEFILVG